MPKLKTLEDVLWYSADGTDTNYIAKEIRKLCKRCLDKGLDARAYGAMYTTLEEEMKKRKMI